MPHITQDGLADYTSIQGTGPFHLDGALPGYVTMYRQLSDGDTVDYYAVNAAGTEWELGTGKFLKYRRQLTRVPQLSSNSNNLVNFGAGVKTVTVILRQTPFKAPNGALVKLTSDETITASTWTPIPWDSEIYDTAGCWDGGSATRLTVPAGVFWVRVSGQYQWKYVSGSWAWSYEAFAIYKNGGRAVGLPEWHHDMIVNDVSNGLNGVSAPIQVQPGDYFELYCQHNNSATFAIDSTAGRSWFCMECLA